eukprot:Gregarina_sp_Poly_1__1420@NODE_1353_length_4308_cov_234_773638_g907_i0_p1_GENE_NODE_1353_length_4308_cov_234_773638_g907_i0NODE_1353_length_4308_cov_234_773638_g907_i0_p1_ORF_typecomplete_len677_score85_63Bactofilin/PF04519_13/1_4e03Bactofilin/PF04519_13/1_4Bactofilin/PF04519_13/27Bactofilin/PF04519_13/2_8e03_NODE_1353_length_4308_cov_234_773638_g907_i0912121
MLCLSIYIVACVGVISFENNVSRFPLLARLIQLPYEKLLNEFVPDPSETATTFNDDSCPSFLVTGDLLVCGNLFVRSRLQILSAANLTVFEEALFEQDDSINNIVIKTHTVGKFLAQRCSRQFPLLATEDPPICSVKGNLVVAGAGLIVSGSLTVLGSVMAGSFQLDAAASAALGVGAFLGLHGAGLQNFGDDQVSPELPRRTATRAARRNTRRVVGSMPPVLDIWPAAISKDPLCLQRQQIPDALFIPKGMMFLRNSASLFTFGKIISSFVGLDRAAHWLARCGGITLLTPEGTPSHMGLMSASRLRVTGNDVVETGSLVVADGSSITVEEKLLVHDLCKVFQSSALEVTGEADFFDLAMSRSSSATVGRIYVKDLAVLTQGTLRVLNDLRMNSLEAYDGSIIRAMSGMQIEDYLVLDDGSSLTVMAGNAVIGGALMAANFSMLSIKDPSGSMTVGEDLRARTGVEIEVPLLVVGCSVLLDIFAALIVQYDVFIRQHGILIGPDHKTPPCDPVAPVLFARQSRIYGYGDWTFGGRKLDSSSTGADTPLVSIVDKSVFHLQGSFKASSDNHALLMKNSASMVLSDAKHFSPGKLVMLESAASVKLHSVQLAQFVGLDMSESSAMILTGDTNATAEWIKIVSLSRLVTAIGTKLTLKSLLEIELESEAILNGKLILH